MTRHLPSIHSPDAFEDVSTRAWVTVSMHRSLDDGSKQRVALLRPESWTRTRKATVGGLVRFATQEPTLSGEFTIDSILPFEQPIGPFRDGESQMVTATFVTENARVFTLKLEDGSELTGTHQHPLFSADRNDWVGLADVLEGERLVTRDGEVTVQSVAMDPMRQNVFNLDVQGKHKYLVGHRALWSHNACENNGPGQRPAKRARVREGLVWSDLDHAAQNQITHMMRAFARRADDDLHYQLILWDEARQDSSGWLESLAQRQAELDFRQREVYGVRPENSRWPNPDDDSAEAIIRSRLLDLRARSLFEEHAPAFERLALTRPGADIRLQNLARSYESGMDDGIGNSIASWVQAYWARRRQLQRNHGPMRTGYR